MKRFYPNPNHPLLYKQEAPPPQVLFIPHINHLLRNQPSDSSECIPRKEHFLSLILTIYSLSRLRSIGSLFAWLRYDQLDAVDSYTTRLHNGHMWVQFSVHAFVGLPQNLRHTVIAISLKVLGGDGDGSRSGRGSSGDGSGSGDASGGRPVQRTFRISLRYPFGSVRVGLLRKVATEDGEVSKKIWIEPNGEVSLL
ncbi:hypothetical protein PIB30_004450 [Stylosanthes scabra]|uniref:Uncharacterized protein n=1 Tax=Stylosanthes scabra TaxID=79078 RepID=A0ABU6W1R2_9FABA|nr:hypothetical protein [Stylosanthes scabra]